MLADSVPTMSAPRHQLLAAALLAQIADGTYAVGDRLPTEEQLCATNAMARGTVRQSLERLEQLGMIERRPGAGTTVIAVAPVASYQPFARSAEDIAELASGSRLVRATTDELTVDAALARRIGARAGTKWIRLQGPRAWRARRDAPFCWSEHYLRGDLSRDRLKNPFDIENVKSGVRQTISAALLNERMATALGAEAGSAALVITRRHHDARGRLAAVGIHTHPADRYEIETTV